MRRRIVWLVCFLAVSGAGVTVFSLSRGQESDRVGRRSLDSKTARADSLPKTPANIDFNKLLPLHKQMVLSAQSGMNWLRRAYRPDGRFVHGFVPSLNAALDGDNYLHQLGAALALARTARYTRQAQDVAKAKQAVVTLLLDTKVDPKDKRVRYPVLPSAVVNRLACAGLLVAAINELPQPAEDLIQQSEQLCLFIRAQAQPDGSLNYWDTAKEKPNADAEGINHFPGPALYGLMLSQRSKSASWKTELMRRAGRYYLSWWKTHKHLSPVLWQTAAYREAYFATGDKFFAQAVFEMNDWLMELQYLQLNRHQPHWFGGFMNWLEGKAAAVAPDISSAALGESLAIASQVAKKAAEPVRERRYRDSAEHCLRFVASLQFSEVNTQHFAQWYRPALVGAFHLSHQDGSIRIDYTQQSVCALLQYLQMLGIGKM